MKKIIFILFPFLFCVCANAQQDINTTFATQMNTVFGSLDKTKVPHGILLDYGMEFTNVPAYNGVLTDSTYSDKSSLKQIYNTLLSSRVRELSTTWVTPTEYETRWNSNRTAGVIALSGLYFKYSQFANNALTANKITLSSNKFYDKFISGVWQNPYQELQTFAMAPPIKQYDELTMQIKIPSNIFISNYQSLVTSIQIDFDNGQGYVTIPYNQNITVSYTSNGLKIWKYKLNLADGSNMYNQSRIKIGRDTTTPIEFPQPIPPVCELCKTSTTAKTTTTKQLYGQNITATIPYLGGLGTVKLTIDYAGDPNQGLKKPLIVAEGFDLGVVLNPEKSYGNFTYLNFRKFLESSGSELRNLLYEDNKQYDIIYVDWDNGVDYMQRNAYSLEAVINWVNAQKVLSGSTTKNVILGQSMGGVIARYALADMEQRGLDHKTSLFISHDAPQQGANIPIAVQYMYRHLTRQYMQAGQTLFGGLVTLPIAENKFDVSNYTSIQDAPASRQLLKNAINLDYSTDMASSTNFYDELKAKGLTNSGGYPLQCRNIAISNGSECGSLQSFNPGDDLVNFQLNKGLSFWGDLLSLVYNPLGGAIGGAFIDNDLYGVAILGTLPGHSKYNVDFQAKSLYNASGNQIYKGRVSYTKKILWVLNVTIDITNVTKSQPTGILSFDTYGGGYFDTKTLAGTINSPNLVIRDHFGFIPTASALDIGKRNIALIDADYKKSYVGAIPPVAPLNSPFSNFTTDFDKVNPNAHNKQHISFDPRNGKWLASELNAITNTGNSPQTTNCSFICSGSASIVITGNSSINSAVSGCGSSIYSIPNVADIYRWTIPENSNYVTLTGDITNAATVTAVSGFSGNITLSLTYGSESCGYATITKRIWVGQPTFNVQKVSDSCGTYRFTTLTITNTDTSHTYDYSFFDLPTGVSYTNTSNNTFLFKISNTYTASYFTYGVKATLGCSSSSYHNYTMLGSCPSTNSTSTLRTAATEETAIYAVYPNPSSDILNISLMDENTAPITTSKITATLYDLNGKEKQSVTVNNNIASLNVNHFKNGIYVLKINIDDQVESHQVIIE